MPNLILKRKEAKTLKFTVTDKTTSAAIDVSTATFSFEAKASDALAGVAVISKADSAFDKTDAATGIVKLPLSESDLDLAQEFYACELKTLFSSSNIDKSDTLRIQIIEAVHN